MSHDRNAHRVCLATILLLLVVCPCLVIGQTEIVIPAVVTDKSGSGVPNLQKNDFSIHARDASLVGVEQIPPTKTFGGTGLEPLFIFYDALSVPPPFQGNISRAVLSVLSRAAETNDPISVVVNSGNGLQVVHDLGTPNAILAAAIRGVNAKQNQGLPAGVQAAPEFESKVAEEVSRLEILTKLLPNGGDIPNLPTAFRQLAGLQQFAAVAQRIAGRKILVWIGAYFPIEATNGELNFNSFTPNHMPGLKYLAVAYQHAIGSLDLAHISVCPLQVEGPTPRDPSFSYAERTQSGLEFLARQTGGVLLTSNSVPEAVAEARRASGPYYVLHLGVKAAKTPTWISLKVKAGKPGTRVRSAAGFFEIP